MRNHLGYSLFDFCYNRNVDWKGWSEFFALISTKTTLKNISDKIDQELNLGMKISPSIEQIFEAFLVTESYKN